MRIQHALFITGLFIAFSGIGIIVETIEKNEHEN
jgi:divalent metal cation (Fe/Co/Zn/Cd) transporter